MSKTVNSYLQKTSQHLFGYFTGKEKKTAQLMTVIPIGTSAYQLRFNGNSVSVFIIPDTSTFQKESTAGKKYISHTLKDILFPKELAEERRAVPHFKAIVPVLAHFPKLVAEISGKYNYANRDERQQAQVELSTALQNYMLQVNSTSSELPTTLKEVA